MNFITVASNDYPWLARGVRETTYNTYLTTGNACFDPADPSKIIITSGVGVWEYQVVDGVKAGSNNPVTLYSRNLGINNLVAADAVVSGAGRLITANYDYGVLPFPRPDIPPTQNWPKPVFAPVMSIDQSVDNPKWLACSGEPGYGVGVSANAISQDGGLTWTPYNPPANASPNHWGDIAVSQAGHILYGMNVYAPQYSVDGGVTWNVCGAFPTMPGGWDPTWFDNSVWYNRRTICNDKVTAGTFYLLHPQYGIFRSTNSGATWALQYASTGLVGTCPETWPYYSAWMDSMPNLAGRLFFTTGPQSNFHAPAPATQRFMQSSDGGSHWTPVPNMFGVTCFGFGAAAPGSSYATIYAAGWYGPAGAGVYGIYYSTDNAVTWNLLAYNPGNSLCQMQVIKGDPVIYGQVYVGFNGAGWCYLPVNETN